MTAKTRKIAVFVGSIRKQSINLKLAKTIEQSILSEVIFEYIPILNLPIYNQDLEYEPLTEVIELKNKIINANSILFVTPEHNRSIPSALKNAIDWASRPWGANSWENKTAAIIGASPSPLGASLAQYHLRNILSALGMTVMPKPEMLLQCHDNIFDSTSLLINEENTLNFIKTWSKEYLKWINKN
ncbi:putative flavoprotein [Candidatus Kinetoplastibacterium desouzaii TCC079E]|uniref:Putative flavoprotein n=1 Tax=Candidatus Kinetoplastidibacterium desouzai TCC079E TaxID=1208919 RepID=M1LRC7_9PROT|nr:NAD(P)H-dependent oxidoreductase [Candidatus Kinetoplastibacterium desouzaii]AGF46711.1 putative flavoprotein [Candidatus Kinetoplastibacterium desouzaii TCC079E]